MKKTKLIGLSLLAFSAVGALASCGGQKEPVSKPDVYFRASALIKGNAQKKKELEIKTGPDGYSKTEFKDSECAIVTVADKDNLEYGKQDVVINIRPQNFFTFRKYDADWAAEEDSTPSRPYVGLGNPFALYSYPLQENVAWTFKDKSTPVEGYPGFYNEEYEITVKKEFFKKNIVIDYGNVEGYDNNVYVYNSERYESLFQNKLEGNFQNIYELNEEMSSFAAASKGATITYTFKSKEHPYTFAGWDNEFEQSPTNSNADAKKYYKHFKVEGGVKNAKTGGIDWTNIAYYDPNAEEQDFTPTVVDNTALSFFIKWSVLAGGPNDGYEPKFDNIRVTLNEPSIKSDFKIKVTHDEDITVYPSGFFQYPDKDHSKPLVDSEGSCTNYETYDLNDFNTLSLANVLHTQNTLPSLQYSTLFKLPDEKKNYFSVEIGGVKMFNVDLVTSELQYTKWRGNAEQRGSNIGVETPYWSYKDSWYLVLLNPSKDLKGNGPRTYGFNGASEKFIGGDNLFYLYTDKSVIKGTEAINIKCEKAPVLISFTLDNDSRSYGMLDPTFTDYSKEYNCVGQSELKIKYYVKPIYLTCEFEIAVTNTSSQPSKIQWEAAYTRESYSDYGIIRIYPNISSGRFSEGDKFELKVTPAESKVLLNANSKVLGCLVDDDGADVTSDEYTPKTAIGKNSIDFTFHLNANYASKAIKDNGDGTFETSEDVYCDVYINGEMQTDPLEKEAIDSDKFTFSVNVGTEILTHGLKFEISVKFACLNPIITGGVEAGDIFVSSYSSLGLAVGVVEELTIKFIDLSDPIVGANIAVNSDLTDLASEPILDVNTELGEITINLEFNSVLQNGTTLTIDIEFLTE